MVSLRRSTSVLVILLALLLSLTSVGMVALPAQAATASTVITINSASPTMNRLGAGTCSQSGTTAHYTVIKYSTKGVGNMAMGLNVKTSAPVTAMLFQGIFMPEMPYVNCYILAWNQAAGQVKVTNTGYNNSTLPDFPDQTWYLVLASDDPGAGVSAEVNVTTSLGTVSIDAAPPAITTASLPQGVYGAAYSTTVAASGGTAPLTFSAAGLPAGLSMSAAGVISGTPREAGTFTASVTVTDAQGRTATRNLGLNTSAPTISMTPTMVPAATVAVAYSQSVAAAGGIAPYSYAVSAGALPAGLSISPGGVLSGTPTAGGTFNFTIRATDTGGFTGFRSYSLSVGAPTITIAPLTMPAMQVLDPVTVAVAASGGTAPYTYSVTAGALPAGVTLSSSGALTGTPTTAGAYSVTVTARDSSTGSGPFTGSRAYSGTVAPAQLPVITPATVPDGVAGQAYSQQLTGGNGVAPYTFSLASGALPAGLSVSDAGLVSGTPTASGTFAMGIKVTDSRGRASTAAYQLLVAKAAVVVGPTTLPTATAYSPYTATMSASGGVGPHSFAVTAGDLPSGLTLASNGALSGTTTESGTFNLTVTATDSSTGTGPATSARAYSLTVNAATLPSITPGTVPGGTAGTAYSQQLSGATGVAPYTFSVATGTLPNGVGLSPSGLLSGTPTVSGSFAVGIKVVDARTLASTSTYTLSIAAPVITVTPATLPGPTVGVDYSADAVATGGSAPHSFAVTAGSLPAGLSLTSAGKLAGTPTLPGTSNFTITATDKYGFTGSRAYSLFSTPAPLVLGPATLPTPSAGDAYTAQLTTTGGFGTFSYTITAGQLPTGLELNTDTGLISGTPKEVGSYGFTVTSTDVATAGPNPVSVNRSYTVLVPSVPLTLIGTLPQAHVGSVYAGALAGTGGTGPYTFALQPLAALPAGLSLGANGLLSGTPTTAGDVELDVVLTDVYGSRSNATASLTVAPLVVVAPDDLPGAQTGSGYSQQLTASGGTAPYTFAVTAGSLPGGLSLSASGALTGTPTVHGNSTFTVTAKDAGGFPGAKEYSVTTIPAAVVLGPETLPVPAAGTEYTVQLASAGGIGPFSYSVTAGSLPTGLTLAEDTGLIAGTPTAVGSFDFTVTTTDQGTANDPLPVTAARDYTVEVPSVPLVLDETKPLPQAQSGQVYTGQLAVTGGSAPYTFALGGTGARMARAVSAPTSLPQGLSLSSSGVLSGTPTVSGDFKLSLVVTDAYGSTSEVTAALTIVPAATPSPTPSATPSVSPKPTTASPQPATSGNGKLATTGSTGAGWLVGGGLGVLALGLVAMGVGRRRTHG